MIETGVRAGVIAAFMIVGSPLSAHGSGANAAAPATLAPARSAAATVDAFHAALHHGDTRAAAALLADDALIFEEGGVERSKAEYVSHHLPADVALDRKSVV